MLNDRNESTSALFGINIHYMKPADIKVKIWVKFKYLEI